MIGWAIAYTLVGFVLVLVTALRDKQFATMFSGDSDWWTVLLWATMLLWPLSLGAWWLAKVWDGLGRAFVRLAVKVLERREQRRNPDQGEMVHPGYITSKHDGDRHYIDGHQLISLYGLDRKETVIAHDANENDPDYDHYFPSEEGDYPQTDRTQQ